MKLSNLAEIDDVDDGSTGDTNPRRRSRMRLIGGVSAAVIAAVAGGLWLAREPIADGFIARELAARGVQGTYQVTRIGPKTQRLESLVIGNPQQPDLTARLVQIDIGWGFTGPYIEGVQASGVLLRGAFQDGTLNLGQVSRLLEGGSGKAQLPPWTVALEDTRAEISTPFGPVVASLDGQGPLRSGFNGRLRLSAPLLQSGDCGMARLIAPLTMSTADERITLKGIMSSTAFRCEALDLTLAAPELDINLRTDLALEDIGGAISMNADGAGQGARRLYQLSGLATFKGSEQDLRGSMSLAATKAVVDGVQSDAAKIGGNFAVALEPRNRALAWQGTATLDNARPSGGVDLRRYRRMGADTPVGPLVSKLVGAIEAIGRSNRIELGGRVNVLGDRGNARLDRLALSAASGAHVESWEGSTVRLDWPGKLRASGRIDIRGGGLPEGRIDFATNPGGGIAGTAALKPYAQEGAQLQLTPVRFSVDGAGRAQIRTVATLDGPLPDGMVRGLKAPLDLRLSPRGQFSIATECVPVSWTSFALSGLVLNPATIRICGVDDGHLGTNALALEGKLGSNPLRFTAASTRYSIGDGTFDLTAPDVKIGPLDSPVRLAASSLQGALRPQGGLEGVIKAGEGRIGTVPLDLTQIDGRWTFAKSRLDVTGALRVSDTQAEARFTPINADAVRFSLIDNKIEATAKLVQPQRNIQVASVNIRHNLSSGIGSADIALDKLRFGEAIQPDDLTPLALGVVANVNGVVEGKGHIRWTGSTVTSDGVFSTQGMSFAAAFGPVSGLSTTMNFTDLLGLRTAPGQLVTVDSVNPGIDVRDGTIRYALLSSEQARIEGGRWPFSGGVLELLPARLELDSRKARNLTFRVVGMDAGAFINTLELENISATGTFDGLLPMVFDQSGGRIEGGLLVARQQGNAPLYIEATQGVNIPCDPTRQSGTLSYVGEISNAQLGTFGKLAFDALKNLRYRCLAVMLDGAIDGEFLTRLSINGVNQGTEEARKSFIARPFLGLPFIFNIRIEAPFRGLLNTATGLADPSKLISGALGDQFTPVGPQGAIIQTPDSDKSVKGN